MQSDGNSFCGDVVLESFNKASQDEDKILDQIFKSKHSSSTKTEFYEFLVLYFFEYAFSSLHYMSVQENCGDTMATSLA